MKLSFLWKTLSKTAKETIITIIEQEKAFTEIKKLNIKRVSFSPMVLQEFGMYHEFRVYLDEYPEQKEERKRFFALRRNLQNEYLKKVG